MNFEPVNMQLKVVASTGTLDRRTLGDWLSSLNFKDTQADVLDQRTDGTGQWFLESDEFNAWLVSVVPQTLWCTGMRKILILGSICLLSLIVCL